MIKVSYASQAHKLQMAPVEFRIQTIVFHMIMEIHALISYMDGITPRITKLHTNKLNQMDKKVLIVILKMVKIVYLYPILLVNLGINQNV